MIINQVNLTLFKVAETTLQAFIRCKLWF